MAEIDYPPRYEQWIQDAVQNAWRRIRERFPAAAVEERLRSTTPLSLLGQIDNDEMRRIIFPELLKAYRLIMRDAEDRIAKRLSLEDLDDLIRARLLFVMGEMIAAARAMWLQMIQRLQTALIGLAPGEPDPIPRVVKDIRSSIGLTARQEQAVNRFREGLERQRELAILARDENAALSPQLRSWYRRQRVRQQQQIDALVANYRNRLLAHRARMIARTESVWAVNQSLLANWQEALRRGVLEARKVRRKWITVRDERLCPQCRPMHDQEVELQEPFVDGFGDFWMHPPVHPNCRCQMVLVQKP